jgi:hypothetical protein
LNVRGALRKAGGSALADRSPNENSVAFAAADDASGALEAGEGTCALGRVDGGAPADGGMSGNGTLFGVAEVLRSVTIPFKNLIQYLSSKPFAPAEPPSRHYIPSRVLSSSSVPSRTHSSDQTNPSSLVLSSTRSSVKTPDTYPDPNHLLCHTNDITLLDPDPDPDL